MDGYFIEVLLLFKESVDISIIFAQYLFLYDKPCLMKSFLYLSLVTVMMGCTNGIEKRKQLLYPEILLLHPRMRFQNYSWIVLRWNSLLLKALLGKVYKIKAHKAPSILLLHQYYNIASAPVIRYQPPVDDSLI